MVCKVKKKRKTRLTLRTVRGECAGEWVGRRVRGLVATDPGPPTLLGYTRQNKVKQNKTKNKQKRRQELTLAMAPL